MIVAQIVREFLGVSAVAATCTKKLSLGNRIIRDPGSAAQRVRSSDIAAGLS